MDFNFASILLPPQTLPDLAASCFEIPSPSETTKSDLKNGSEEETVSTTIMDKRQLLPLPRAGRSFWRTRRSEGLVPLPRAGRMDARGAIPMPRTGRSDGLLPIMRAGRSEGMLPFPRAGRSRTDQGLVPMPRTGRSEGMLPFPRAGRSEGMLPFPRAGRSEGMLPFPRAGRSDGMLPFPRAGRSEGMLPFPRAGRSDGQGLLPMPRAGRSEGILPFPRSGRSSSEPAVDEDDMFQFSRDQRSTDGLVPMPRAGRSLPFPSSLSDCSDSSDCSEMHESLDSNSEEDNFPPRYSLGRSKRSLNDSSVENKTGNEPPPESIPRKSDNSSSASHDVEDESNEFVLNGMTFVLKPKPRMMLSDYDEDGVFDRVGRGLERRWIEFEKAFSFRYPIPSRPLLYMSGAPSSNFFSNSLEDEMESNNMDPIDLQLRAVYIPRIGKRTQSAANIGVPNFSTPEWFKRTGASGSGPAFQPRIGRSSFFQPRTGRSMNGATDDDELGVDEVILEGRPSRSSFTPRIGRSVRAGSVQGQKQSNDQTKSTNQASS